MNHQPVTNPPTLPTINNVLLDKAIAPLKDLRSTVEHVITTCDPAEVAAHSATLSKVNDLMSHFLTLKQRTKI